MHQSFKRMKNHSRILFRRLAVFVIALCLAGCSSNFSINPRNLVATRVPLPNSTGFTFTDLSFDPRLYQVIVPTGIGGEVFLINPEDPQEIKTISTGSEGEPGTKGEDIVSVASGQGKLFLLDQSRPAIHIVDAETGAALRVVPVMDTPELVRFVPPNQVWVTEPGLEQIEVFSLSPIDPSILVSSKTIPVEKGPSGLAVDSSHGLVYTNQPAKGLTSAIQIRTHRIIRTWGNGCTDARGMALDEERAYLFIACAEGKLVLADVLNGIQITSIAYGGDLNQVSYNPQKKHVYLPSGASAILGIFEVAVTEASVTSTDPANPASDLPSTGRSIVLRQIGSADTAINSDCVATDDRDNIWLCDPSTGQMLLVKDSFGEDSSK